MSITLGIGVFAVSAVFAPAARACGHTYVEATLYSGVVQRAGVGVGTTGTGQGLWLGQGDQTCFRVTSISAYHDGNNIVEIGAYKIPGGGVSCVPSIPSGDQTWYRFWTHTVDKKCYHPTYDQLVPESQNHYYTANVHRDPNNVYDWILDWAGSRWLTLTSGGGSQSSGIPVESTERGGSGDSMYAEFDGTAYQSTDTAWHLWDGVANWCDTDTGYDVDPTGSGINDFYSRGPESLNSC